tara:strand:- start:818 stop:1018 length:201 start_codon:yes stop_codon:yes gene_type:complete
VKAAVIHAPSPSPPKVVAPAPAKVIVQPAHPVNTAEVNNFEAGLKSYFAKENTKKASDELKKYHHL